MVKIPGGTFCMGSDKHYPDEAPAHRVTVGAFWIDRTPVTNRQFNELVRATGHITLHLPRFHWIQSHAQPVDTSTNHIGFRCVVRER